MIIAAISCILVSIAITIYYIIKYVSSLNAVSGPEFVELAQNPFKGVEAIKQMNNYKTMMIIMICVTAAIMIFFVLTFVFKNKIKAKFAQFKLEKEKKKAMEKEKNTCPKCKKLIPAGAEFCNNCGTKRINPADSASFSANVVNVKSELQNFSAPGKICSKCGNNVGTQKFCTKCGNPVSDD